MVIVRSSYTHLHCDVVSVLVVSLRYGRVLIGGRRASSCRSWARAEKVKVKVNVYSPDIPKRFSRFCINYPGIGTNSFTVSSPWGKCSAIFCSCSHSHTTTFHSNWYPLLLGGQRLSHMTGIAGIEPQTTRSWVELLCHSAKRSTGKIQ